jgi:hypothetical protein
MSSIPTSLAEIRCQSTVRGLGAVQDALNIERRAAGGRFNVRAKFKLVVNRKTDRIWPRDSESVLLRADGVIQ